MRAHPLSYNRSIWNNFFNIGIFQAAGMLIQLFAIPIIIRKYGLPVFGEVALVTSIGALLANIINFGTNQTEIKEISIRREDNSVLSAIFSEILYLKIFVFIFLFIAIAFLAMTTNFLTPFFFLSVIPILVAEIFNPLYFLIGIEKVQWISWGNMISKLMSLLLIVFVELNTQISVSLNLFLSIPALIFNTCLTFYLAQKFSMKFRLISMGRLKCKLKENAYVTFNGSSVLLQQSLFIFFVSKTFSPAILGAYGIIDKLLSSFRLIISAFSSAIYPKAAQLYQQSNLLWKDFRKNIQKAYFIFFIFVALIIVSFAHQLASIITSSPNEVIVFFLRYFSLVPLIVAMNANNVLEMLLSNMYKQMFATSLILIAFTCIATYIFTNLLNQSYLGFYPLIMEIACLFIYTQILRFK